MAPNTLNKMENRYNRQILLPEIGPAGQMRLAGARILCVGAGGLGCPALLYLAGAGVGTLGIIDHDRVDVTNLHRQILFTANDAGQSKAVAARTRLAAINPDITIQAYDEKLSPENALSLFSGYDVIIDATDNFKTRFLINDMAVRLSKPVIFAAIQGFDGQVCVFDSAHGACYRCLYPAPPKAEIQNCAEAGVLGPMTGILGSLQALEAVKIIVGPPAFQNPSGRMVLIDGKTLETRQVAIQKSATCPACSGVKNSPIPQTTGQVCMVADIVAEIEIGALSSLKNATLFDVRERNEWDCGFIPGAHHLPLSTLQHDTSLFTPPGGDTPCVLYCQRGMRSERAVHLLQQAGFTNLYSLTGGYDAWAKAQD